MMRLCSPISLFILTTLLGSACSLRMKTGEKKLPIAGSMSFVQAETNSSRFCNPWGSRTLKTYFFEFKFAEREYPTAMSLTRDPTDPQLNVFDDMSWVIHMRDKTTVFVDCSKSVNTAHTKIYTNRTGEQKWEEPDKCGKDLDGQKGFMPLIFKLGSLNNEVSCSGWSWFGQCPEILQVTLTDGRIVYLPKDNVRRTANSKPEGDGWIVQDSQGHSAGHSDQPLYWRAECAQNATECSSTHQVIKLRNLASITRRHEEVKDPETGLVERLSGIRLKHTNGTEQDLFGGIYYPYETMRQLTWESRWYGAKKSTDCFNCTQAPGEHLDRMAALSLIWEGRASRGTIFRGSMLALIAGFGFVAPITTGLLIWGGSDRAYDWWLAHKHVQELKLSPSEKIWSKLECHAMFQRCSEDVLVPKGKSCDGI